MKSIGKAWGGQPLWACPPPPHTHTHTHTKLFWSFFYQNWCPPPKKEAHLTDFEKLTMKPLKLYWKISLKNEPPFQEIIPRGEKTQKLNTAINICFT